MPHIPTAPGTSSAFSPGEDQERQGHVSVRRRGWEQAYSLVACPSHFTVDQTSLSRRSTVPTPDRVGKGRVSQNPVESFRVDRGMPESGLVYVGSWTPVQVRSMHRAPLVKKWQLTRLPTVSIGGWRTNGGVHTDAPGCTCRLSRLGEAYRGLPSAS